MQKPCDVAALAKENALDPFTRFVERLPGAGAAGEDKERKEARGRAEQAEKMVGLHGLIPTCGSDRLGIQHCKHINALVAPLLHLLPLLLLGRSRSHIKDSHHRSLLFIQFL